ncbi:hypothetical protein [Legionella sp. WA2024007413]
MSMSKTEPKYYYLEDTVAKIFIARGEASFLKRNNREDNQEIKRDLYQRAPVFRVPQIRETMEACYLPTCELHLLEQVLPENLDEYKGSYVYCNNNEDKKLYYIDSDGKSKEVPITDFIKFDDRLKEINQQETNLLHLSTEQVIELITSNGGFTHDKDPIRNRYFQGDIFAGNLKFLLGNMPFYDLNDPEADENSPKVVDEGGGYLDAKGSPSGVSIFAQIGKPENWMIIVTKDTHLPPEQRKAYVLSSVDLRIFLTKELKTIEESNLPKMDALQQAADSPAISAILGNILDENGKIKEHANILFNLFTGVFYKDQKFDDDPQWMDLVEKRAADIIKNQILIALHEMGMQLSLKQVKACIDDSDLSKLLNFILENDKSSDKIQHIQLALNLESLNQIERYSDFEQDSGEFIAFFNNLASQTENHNLLSSILQKQKLDYLRSLYKCKNADKLMKSILQDDEPFLRLQKIHEIVDAAKKEGAKNKNVYLLTVQFLLAHPELEDKIKKLVDFLNNAPGIEHIQLDKWIQFLSQNLDDAKLLDSVTRTLTKLDALRITDSKSYELVLNAEFRQIVLDLEPKESKEPKDGKVVVQDVKEAKKVKDTEDIQRIQLATNLAELGHLSAFSQLSPNIHWVSSFNQLVKNKASSDILSKRLKSEDVAKACKPLLENSLLNGLVTEQIGLNETQIYTILEPKKALTKKLQTIAKETNEELAKKLQTITKEPGDQKAKEKKVKEVKEEVAKRKKALDQLALDLDKIGVLGWFDKLKKEDNKFLELFHNFVNVSNSESLLQMLFQDPLGLDKLRLIALSNTATPFFTKFVALQQTDNVNFKNINANLRWLVGENLPPTTMLVAMELLFKQPKITHDEFKDVVFGFLKDTYIPNFTSLNTQALSDFLSKHYKKGDEVRLEVRNSFHKLAENNIRSEEHYLKVLKSPDFRRNVLSLPQISEGKQPCGLFEMHTVPSLDQLRTGSSRYILTGKGLFYFNAEAPESKSLLTISEDPATIASLRKQFTKLPIVNLTKEGFRQLSEIVPIKEYNAQRIKLMSSLYEMGHLEKYNRLAANNELVSYFNKFHVFLHLKYAMQDKLDKPFTSDIISLLENKRLRALMDANIEPNTFASTAQIQQLLNSKHPKSMAMDILLALNLKNKIAYKLAFIDSPKAKNFRVILSDLNDSEEMETATKSKIIETLCSIEFGDRYGRGGKDVFSLYLRDEQGTQFKEIVRNLLPVSDQEEPCDFFKRDIAPGADELATYQRSRFILTDNALLYFNKADQRLLTLSQDPSTIASLKARFFNLPIEALTDERFKQLTQSVSIHKINAQLTTLAFNLCEFGHLDKYNQFTDLQQISNFNKFYDIPDLKKVLEEKLNISVEEAKKLLENKYLLSLLDLGVEPTKELVEQLLNPEEATPQFQATSSKNQFLDILWQLDIKNKKAYTWAMDDSSDDAKNFKKVVIKISKESQPEATKTKLIETLCALQTTGKDVFSMYLNEQEQGKKFRSSLFKIEATCAKIADRWNEERSEATQAKAKSFAAAGQEYREGLYGAVFDNLSKLSTGCELYIGSELPEKADQLAKNSYIFINTNDTKKLYYIKPDGKYEQVKIDNFGTFEQEISVLKKDNKDASQIHLDAEHIEKLVTANGGHIPFKEEFGTNIAKASQNMLSVVDVRRRNWLMAIVETLADALNVISFTGFKRVTDYVVTNSKKTTFFSQTTSGHEVRNLNESLKDPQKIMKEYKSQLKGGNEEAEHSDGFDVKV